MFIFIILLVIVVSIALVHWSRRKYAYWKDRNIKYLKPSLIIGNYGDYILQKKTIGETTQEICEQFPNEGIIGAFYGTEPVAIVQDPEYIKLVLTKDFYYFSGREITEHCEKEVLTRMIFFTGGDNWRVLRQNLSPLFTSARLKSMYPLLENCSKDFEKMLRGMKETKELDINNVMAKFTIDCICSVGFGIESKVMEGNGTNNVFVNIADSIFDASLVRGAKLVFRAIWPRVFYSLGLRWFPKQITDYFALILKQVYEDRNYEPSSRKDFADFFMEFHQKDFLSGTSMKSLKTGDNDTVKLKLDGELCAAQSISLFAAGFETSATTSAFLLYELAKNPDIQDKVLQELDDRLPDGIVNYDNITSLPYLKQCVLETLRLYPVLSTITREVYEDYTFANGLQLDRGTRVHIPVICLHRNPKYYPEPNKFDPERFSEKSIKNLAPYTFFPFGEGPRICLGMRLAYLQVNIGLVTLLKNYRVVASAGTPRNVTFVPMSIVTHSKQKLMLKLVSRKL